MPAKRSKTVAVTKAPATTDAPATVAAAAPSPRRSTRGRPAAAAAAAANDEEEEEKDDEEEEEEDEEAPRRKPTARSAATRGAKAKSAAKAAAPEAAEASVPAGAAADGDGDEDDAAAAAAPKRKRARSATKKPAAADDGDDENKNDGDDDAAAPAAAPPKRSGGKKPKLESAASSSAAADYILPASRPTNSVMPGVYTFHTLPPAPAGTAGTSANPDEVKIITWNVAGIKAALGKGMLAYIAAENPDVVCLQETKTVGEPDGGLLRDVYPFQYWSGLPAGETKKSKYYGGVALLSKIAPVAVSGEIGVGMPMDGEGRAVVAEFRDFHLINTYVPNASTALARLPDKQKYNAALETLMNRLDKTKPVLWTGDLNVSHKEIDLANPKTNTKSPGFTPEERADFSRILAGPSDPSSSPAFVDVWRHLNPNVQDYSYFSYRFAARAKYIGWRLDYFVVSRRAVDNGNVRGCVMRTEAYGAADHVPVVLGLRSLRL